MGDKTFSNLAPALAQTFVIILLGYALGRFKVVPLEAARAIGQFVSLISLPALLFLKMATLDFGTIDWVFLLGITISKSAVFVFVAIMTIVMKKGRPNRAGHAGLRGIFATQSNDFALGLPIVQALYDSTHPAYAGFLYLVAPISLILLNPIGFVMMEYGAQKEQRAVEESFNASSVSGRPARRSGIPWLRIMKNVLTNPIVFMCILGIAGNFAFDRHVPKTLAMILQPLGDAFSGCSLFCLGLSMVGKLGKIKRKGVLVPLLLIACKSLVLPIVSQHVISALGGSKDLSMYGFVYGTFPTAPSVPFYAFDYNMGGDMIAAAMVMGTLLSAPLMFVTAKMAAINIGTTDTSDYDGTVRDAAMDIGYVGLAAAFWVMVVLIPGRRFVRFPYSPIFFLALTQFAFPFAGSFCPIDAGSTGSAIRFAVIFCGILASRGWTVALALNAYLVRVKGEVVARGAVVWMHVIGWGVPLISIAPLVYAGKSAFGHDETLHCWFLYGRTQFLVTTVTLSLCTIACITFMVLVKYHQRAMSMGASVRTLGGRQYVALGDGDEPVSSEGGREDASPESSTDSESDDDDTRSINSLTAAEESSLSAEARRRLHEARGRASTSGVAMADSASFTGDGGIVAVDEGVATPSNASQVLVVDPLEASIAREAKEAALDDMEREHMPVAYLQLRPQDGHHKSDVRLVDGSFFPLFRHQIFVLYGCVSMALGISVCFYNFLNETPTGLQVEIELLDSCLLFAQGIVTFCLFGVTKPMLRPYVAWFTRVRAKLNLASSRSFQSMMSPGKCDSRR
eukprot:Opistho-1_new@84404